MKGFDKQFKDLPDYILKITYPATIIGIVEMTRFIKIKECLSISGLSIILIENKSPSRVLR